MVVRGGLLEITTLRADAEAAYERFGEHGISVFGAADEGALHELARTRVSAFEVLTLMTVGALRAAGLEPVPTFRRPHFTILLPDLETDLLKLLACENEIWVNPYHPRPGDRP
jgi:hypothetical protein